MSKGLTVLLGIGLHEVEFAFILGSIHRGAVAGTCSLKKFIYSKADTKRAVFKRKKVVKNINAY